MEKQNNGYLGIDISKEKIDITLLLEERSFHKVYSNNGKGYEKLYDYLSSNNVNQVHVCMEATGKYNVGVASYLYNKGCKVSIVNPFKIRSFKNTKLSRSKTDSYDSYMIAEYCKMYNPREWYPESKEKVELKNLYRTLESYKKELNRQTNQIEQYVGEEKLLCIKKETVLHIRGQIKKIEVLIESFLNGNQKSKREYDLLLTIPGIAKKTAIALLAELPELSNYKTARELASYIGITPHHNVSGKSIKRSSISKIGSSVLRKILYFPAVVARVFSDRLSNFAKKLENKGKVKMVSVIAVMRKLVHIIYGVLNSGEEYKEVKHV